MQHQRTNFAFSAGCSSSHAMLRRIPSRKSTDGW
jgi:hypothetical protein